MTNHLSGPEVLRRAVRILNNCNESAIEDFTAVELLKLCDACMRSDWVCSPDELDDQQAQEALHGIAPRWDAESKPIYARKYAWTVTVHTSCPRTCGGKDSFGVRSKGGFLCKKDAKAWAELEYPPEPGVLIEFTFARRASR